MSDGWKSYLFLILACLGAMIYGLGYIDLKTYLIILSVLGFGSIAEVRRMIKKMLEDLLPKKIKRHR